MFSELLPTLTLKFSLVTLPRQGDAAKMLAGGFAVYALFWQGTVWNDKASKQPFVVRECQPLASDS